MVKNIHVIALSGAGLIIAGGLTTNQVIMNQRVHNLENRPTVIEKVLMATATPTPRLIVTATPSATPVVNKFFYRLTPTPPKVK